MLQGRRWVSGWAVEQSEKNGREEEEEGEDFGRLEGWQIRVLRSDRKNAMDDEASFFKVAERRFGG